MRKLISILLSVMMIITANSTLVVQAADESSTTVSPFLDMQANYGKNGATGADGFKSLIDGDANYHSGNSGLTYSSVTSYKDDSTIHVASFSNGSAHNLKFKLQDHMSHNMTFSTWVRFTGDHAATGTTSRMESFFNIQSYKSDLFKPTYHLGVAAGSTTSQPSRNLYLSRSVYQTTYTSETAEDGTVTRTYGSSASQVASDSNVNYSNQLPLRTSELSAADKQWMHIAGTREWDSENSKYIYKVYKNGELLGTTELALEEEPDLYATQYYLGVPNGQWSLPGKDMALTKVYETTLTDTEMAELYSSEVEHLIPYETEIISYDAEEQSASLTFDEAKTYTVIFADYEDNRLANVDVVEYAADSDGYATVSQTDKSFTLSTGDKIFVWEDLISLKPLCNHYEILSQ